MIRTLCMQAVQCLLEKNGVSAGSIEAVKHRVSSIVCFITQLVSYILHTVGENAVTMRIMSLCYLTYNQL